MWQTTRRGTWVKPLRRQNSWALCKNGFRRHAERTSAILMRAVHGAIDQISVPDSDSALPHCESAGRRTVVSFPNALLFDRREENAVATHSDEQYRLDFGIVSHWHAHTGVFWNLPACCPSGRRVSAGFGGLAMAEAKGEDSTKGGVQPPWGVQEL